MELLALLRTLHVLGVVLWIGGVALVTTVLLPAMRRLPDHENPFELFEKIESRFARQARVVTVITAVTGFCMVHEMGAWGRYLRPEFWWLHAMTFVWVLFTLVLFVLEPLVLHRKLRERARTDAAGALTLMQRAHWVLLTLTLLTVAGAVSGSHGWLWF
ncbi:MAG: hypothetical protein JRG76_19320 [Deltaproteobacteria bacterium]|nr:hypothetical protein [Deltaproteobacteria bacterium]